MIELSAYANERWFLDGKVFLREIDSIISCTGQGLLIRRLPNMPVLYPPKEFVHIERLKKGAVYNIKYAAEFYEDSVLYDFDVKLNYVVNEDDDKGIEAIQSIYFTVIKDNLIPDAVPKERTHAVG